MLKTVQPIFGPAFSAYQTVGQALSSNTITKINFQAEDFDVDGSYDTATSKFQPKVAGYYQLSANVAVAASASLVSCYILKNNTVWKGGATAAGNYSYSTGLSVLVYLNGTTDFAEVGALFSVAQNTEVSAGTWFTGALVRRA